MKKLIILVSLIISTVAIADVPHIFSAGTPAKASEVNQNFDALDSDIKSAKKRIVTLESASGNKTPGSQITSCTAGVIKKHKLSYQAKSLAAGQSLTYNGKSYKLIEVPFREFKTGDLYKIKFPAVVYSGDISSQLTINHASFTCNNLNISGFPAFDYGGVTESRDIFIKNDGSSKSTSTLRIYYSIRIQVGETSLILNFSTGKTETSATVSQGDYDFTDNLDPNQMKHDPSLINAIDDLIDYIKITRIP